MSSSMFDKENRKAVEAMNAALGTKHRTKPYDMNNADDLKHALTLAAAAYRDYTHYLNVLSELDGDFDESLENYDVVSWINIGTKKADELSNACLKSLGKTLSLFDEMADSAKENCAFILKIVLSASEATQKTVLGRAYKIPSQSMDERLEKLFETLDETEYYYPIEDNFDALINLMEEEWGTQKVGDQ